MSRGRDVIDLVLRPTTQNIIPRIPWALHVLESVRQCRAGLGGGVHSDKRDGARAYRASPYLAATQTVGKYPVRFAPRCQQRVALQVQILVAGGDPGVADVHVCYSNTSGVKYT